jgi:hypothetical protein
MPARKRTDIAPVCMVEHSCEQDVCGTRTHWRTSRVGKRMQVHHHHRAIHTQAQANAYGFLFFCVCCSYGYAGASSTRGGAPAGSTAGGNFPTGPGVPHDGSRDSTSSVGSRASTRFLDLRCVV